MNTGRNCIVLVILFLFYGCSYFSGKTVDKGVRTYQDALLYETGDLIESLKHRNEGLATFKGIGHITLMQKDKIQIDERIAWIAAVPKRFSLVILVSGLPALKIASNGTHLFYLNSLVKDNAFKRIPAKDESLKRLISIPITHRDLIKLLSGRIPIYQYDSAELIPDRTGKGKILILKKWWRIVEKIYLDTDLTRVHRIEAFNMSGGLAYRAYLNQLQLVEKYPVPSDITISDSENTVFQLNIEKYWPNIPVIPSMFELRPRTVTAQ